MEHHDTPLLVGHLAPDLDCLAGLWILRRWAGFAAADVAFVAAGGRAEHQGAALHVDTGGGPYDHHDSADRSLSSAELVRRDVRPDDWPLEELVQAVTADDQARAGAGPLRARDLVQGLNLRHPDDPAAVLRAMEPIFDAWYAAACAREEQRRAFAERIEFDTPWGLGIAVEAPEGVASRDAYGMGAVLFAYRDQRGWMGVAAQAQSDVDLAPVYATLGELDAGADWYLHPNRRLLLCGTPKAPPRTPSRLSLDDLIDILRG